MPHCAHDKLQTIPSPYAQEVGYKPYTIQQLFTAATGSRKQVSADFEQYASCFPAPLVLPGDELSQDPKCPPQSFNSWLNEKARNGVTRERETVYVAAPVRLVGLRNTRGKAAGHVMTDWSEPRAGVIAAKERLVQPPPTLDIIAYLQGLFHDLPVKQLPNDLNFTSDSWEHDTAHRCAPPRAFGSNICTCSLPFHVELQSREAGIATRIRVRHLDQAKDTYTPYLHQLNLNDLLDHAIAILPEDAYCLLMMVDQDLYEDENDDFCCGRAYGGSRIAVVSSAQYQPALDGWHGVDVRDGHSWPGSHCSEFVTRTSAVSGSIGKHKRAAADSRSNALTSRPQIGSRSQGLPASDAIIIDSSMLDDGHLDVPPQTAPLDAAVAAHQRALKGKGGLTLADLKSLYLRRLCLTSSHEILHCFGLAHCVYAACAMQSTASMIEDSRQPPYLCIVCEHKLSWAVRGSKMPKSKRTPSSIGNAQPKRPGGEWWSEKEVVDWRISRNRAIMAFCDARGAGGNDLGNLGFASLSSWTAGVLELGSA